jgi:peptidoglycan-associated lipoprotein
MRRFLAWFLGCALAGGGVPALASALEPYVGADIGMTEPLNGNFRGHVDVGFLVSPYVGVELHPNVGFQASPTFYFFSQGGSFPGMPGQGRQETTMVAISGGPRFQLPMESQLGTFVPFIYGSGGYYAGTSGRLSQSAPGWFGGGGVDYRLSDRFSLGGFVRYEYAFMGPRPKDLGPLQVPEERFSEDIRWLSYGFSLRYVFTVPEEAPPAAPPPSAPLASEPAPVLPPPSKRKVVLRSVHFEFDQDRIQPEARPVLDEAYGILRDEPEIHVRAEGHTDAIGTEEYNLRLGERRARAVRQYLVSKGIAPERIQTVSFGESRPVATNDTPEGRAQNRRVELHVVE